MPEVENKQIRTATTNITLNVRDWGGEGPSIILIHGLASTSRIWDFLAPILQQRFHVVAYDQRGHALSDKPEDGYDLATELADLRGLIEALGLQSPYLVGHSWGATLALAYAAEYPDECAGLALVDGGMMDMQAMTGGNDWDAVRERLAPPDLSHLKLNDLVGYMTRNNETHLSRPFAEDFFGSMMDVQADGTVRARLLRNRHLRILRIIWESRPQQLADKVRCPTLVIVAQQASGDPDRDMAAQERLSSVEHTTNLLHARHKLVVMEDTIHDIPLQRPTELAREISGFFSEAGG